MTREEALAPRPGDVLQCFQSLNMLLGAWRPGLRWLPATDPTRMGDIVVFAARVEDGKYVIFSWLSRDGLMSFPYCTSLDAAVDSFRHFFEVIP